jgi:hypothetical protein
MRFCRKSTGPEDVIRTAKPTSTKTGIKTGNMEITQAQSKKRLAPDFDQSLRRPAGEDFDDFETIQSFLEGRSPGCLSPTSEVTRCKDRFILVDSDVSGTYDLVLTMTLHKETDTIGL